MMHKHDAVAHPSQPEVVPIKPLAELPALLSVRLRQFVFAFLFPQLNLKQCFKDTSGKLMRSSDFSSSKLDGCIKFFTSLMSSLINLAAVSHFIFFMQEQDLDD